VCTRGPGIPNFEEIQKVRGGLLLVPRARPGREPLQAKGSAAVTAYLMASVAAGVVGESLFQEDRLDAGLVKLIIKRRLRRRRPLRGEWHRRVECDCRRYQQTGNNSLRTNIRSHNRLQSLRTGVFVAKYPATLGQCQGAETVGHLPNRDASHLFHFLHIDGGHSLYSTAGNVDCLAVRSESDPGRIS